MFKILYHENIQSCFYFGMSLYIPNGKYFTLTHPILYYIHIFYNRKLFHDENQVIIWACHILKCNKCCIFELIWYVTTVGYCITMTYLDIPLCTVWQKSINQCKWHVLKFVTWYLIIYRDCALVYVFLDSGSFTMTCIWTFM